MKISLITGLITLVIGTLGDNCPSFFGGVGCSEIQCVNGGYADSDKNICICPPGYLGIHCEAVKTSRPPKNHYKTGGTSFNILNVNLYTQYWGFKTYENIRTAVEAFQEAYKFDFYNYRYSTGAPSLDQFDNPQGFPIEFEQPPTTSISLNGPTDTGLYWCYQVDIYENLVETIRNASLRNTAITIITQHPPTPDQLEEAQQTTVAFGIRVNVLWISDKTFNRCKNADIAAFKAFSELTGGLFVQLQSELDDAPTQKLVSQVLLTHYRPQFVSIQSFDSCDSPQSVPVVIDPVVKGPYNFVFLGTNALPTSQSFVSCLLQQPLRSFDKKLSFFQSPDPMCQSISVQASGPCTVMVFTNGNYSNPGPVDLSIYTSYVEDQTIDSSRYGMVESVPFYPAIHVEPPSPSSQVTVNSISTSFNSSWNPVLQNRFPAAYEWIPSKTITCDSSKTYSLFLNITVDGSIVQRAVRVACLAAPPPTTIPAETTTVAITTTVTVPSTVETTVTTVTVPSTTETTVTTETVVSSTSTFTTATPCSQPGVPYSFLLSYSTELDSKTFGLVSSTIVQAVRNYPYNNITLTDSYLDSTNDTIQKPASVNDFSIDLEAKLPSPTNALGETLGSNVVPILQKFIAATEGPDKPISYDNSVLLLLPNRLQTSTASDLEDSNYIDFVNKNVKVFTVISLASLIAQGQMVGRTGKVFNRLAAASNGHYIVANETIFGRDVNSDYNKVVAQVMQFGYGQDLLFSRNIGSTRLRTDIGTVSIPKSASGFINITITVSLSVVDTNAPNPPTRLLLALKPAAGSTSGATAINFLTDTTVTRYETSNFYIITITVPAGEDRGMVLQYIPGVDDNDLLIRMWVDRSTYHKAKYVNLALDDGVPDDKEGAALRMTLQNNCYNSIDTHCQAKILITDCNGDVSTKYGSSQVSGNTLTADPAFKYFGFVPFFCDSPPSTSTSCIAGTEAKYDVQFNFEDYSVTRSFWCSKSSEPFDPKCTKQDAYGNYQCTGNSPFKTGPTGKVPDCSGHGSLTVDFTEGIGKEVYSCQCEDGFHPPNCASAKCFSPNLDRLATDNSYHTFTLVMGLDNSVSTFAVIQQDLEKFLKLSAVPSIWKYQLLAYCTDGSVTNLYSGGDFKEFYAMMNTSTIPVNCADCSGPIDGSVDLTTVYNSAVQGIGRNVRGMIVYYTESQKTLAVSLDDFVVASRAYRQELFVFTGYYNETSPTPLPPGNANISLAAISTGGFYVQSLVDTARYILKISDDFVSTILSGKSSLAYVSTEQTTGFNVAVNSTTTVAWVVAWGNGGKFVSDNRAILSESICKTADDTMAMCKLTGATSYNFVAPSDGNAYTTAVFITNEDYLSPRFQIISDLNQDASNAVSTTSSATRTIISMYVPPGYKIVDNDGDGGLTRTIQRDHCTFQSTAYSVFADSKYSAGANTAMITLQQEDGNISSPKYTRYFTFGTSSSPICQNGGTPVASTGSCACPTGFQGPDCSLVNCELASSANAWSDVYSFCQYPKWTFTFFLAYSRQLSARQYNYTVSIVPDALKNYPYQDNVLRNAYLDYEEDEVIGLPKDLNEFTSNILSSPPNPLYIYHSSSNLIRIIQNFIPTAQETSEYSGKTTNWLENSILLMLPKFLPNKADKDLSADNYTSFINKNVKVFIVMSIAEVNAEEGRYDADLKIFSNLAARTNGHWVIVSDADYGRVLQEIMDFGYGKDLIFTRNVGNISGTRELGTLKTPGSLINVTITITESIIKKYPAFLPELKIRINDHRGFDQEINMIDFRFKMSNFYVATIQLPSESTISVSVTYTPPTTASRDLFIRIWTDRAFYQYSEFVDLSFYPTDPNDKEGAAMRMTVLNDCYQEERAHILITDCNGLAIRKDDEEQVSGIPIGTEGSYPKFAFVPYFCDARPSQGSDGCVDGAEGKYDVQLTVGTYSISRSFQCLSGSQPFNPKCTQKDQNGNYYCTRDTVPYKRGPTGQLTDCLGNGHLEFDSEAAEDYVCICDKGWEGQSCEKKSV